MSTQPEALRLAEQDEKTSAILRMEPIYAPELRRLHEVNAELVEALIDLVNEIGDGFVPHKLFVDQALAAIAKATGGAA